MNTPTIPQPTIQVDQDVDVRLTPRHLGVIMSLLQEAPYKVASPVIESIQHQVQTQLRPKQPASAGDPGNTDAGNANAESEGGK